MKLTKTTIALYIGLVFASGIVLGVFGDRLYNASSVSGGLEPGKAPKSNPEEFRKKMVAEWQKRLTLSDDQVVKLNIILDDTRSQFHEARQKMDPEMQAIRQGQQAKIRAMLKPEQREEYEKMLLEREKRDKENRGRRGPGPGF
jgi:hypothetical protein